MLLFGDKTLSYIICTPFEYKIQLERLILTTLFSFFSCVVVVESVFDCACTHIDKIKKMKIVSLNFLDVVLILSFFEISFNLFSYRRNHP